MKKFFAVLLCAGMLLALGAAAWGDVAVDETNFPDANFRSYVSTNCDTDSDGMLTEAEIAAVSENGKMVTFSVRAWDERGPVSAGTHTRAVIQEERFLNRCNAKLTG